MDDDATSGNQSGDVSSSDEGRAGDPGNNLGQVAPESGGEPDSFLDRMLNVFASPSDVFERLASAERDHRNWIIPLLLAAIVGVIHTVAVFSQEDIVAQVGQQQDQQFERMVEDGKLTRDQMESAREVTKKWQTPKVLMLLGSASAVFGNGLFFLVMSVVIWVLAAKILRGDVSFGRATELVGLSYLILVAGGLVSLLLVLLKGDLMAGPNLAILLSEFDQRNPLHLGLQMVSLPAIWFMGVLSLGVGRLTRRQAWIPALWVFCAWLGLRGALIFLTLQFAPGG